jgi:hypothetical protein
MTQNGLHWVRDVTFGEDEVAPKLVGFEVAVPRLMPAGW